MTCSNDGGSIQQKNKMINVCMDAYQQNSQVHDVK